MVTRGWARDWVEEVGGVKRRSDRTLSQQVSMKGQRRCVKTWERVWSDELRETERMELLALMVVAMLIIGDRLMRRILSISRQVSVISRLSSRER